MSKKSKFIASGIVLGAALLAELWCWAWVASGQGVEWWGTLPMLMTSVFTGTGSAVCFGLAVEER